MIITIIATILAVAGTTNWFLIGIFNFNLVTWIFGAGAFSSVIYVLVGLAGLWLLIAMIATGGRTTEVVTTKRTTR